MIRFEGSIAGTHNISYRPRGGKRYSHDDIGKYLRQFKLCNALKTIGKLSHEIFKSDKLFWTIEGIPVRHGILAYLSMQLIENANDYRSRDMNINNLLTAIDMFFGLPDPLEDDSDNVVGCFTRMGSSQLDYNREYRHLLPRTLILYRELWNTIPDSNKIDIGAAIQEVSGLNLQELLVLGYTFSGLSKDGFFRILGEIEECSETLKPYLKVNKQKAFVNWISCTYSEFRSLLKKNSPPTLKHQQFRFNPLHLKPAIIPDRNVKPGFSQVYITPIPSLIHERVTRGLYFALADHFKESKRNPFRDAFGPVFQKYVGLLLKNAVGENSVQQEWRYGSRKHPKDTPDWFVIQNGVAVLIEVKQSGLYLNAKQWGEREQIHKDLKQTIGSGVNQMWEFERNVENGVCPVPDWLKNINITERVVVIYDGSHHLNSFLNDEVRQLYPSISETYHWHTIAVEQLEYFLAITGKNLIEALTEKRLDSQGDSMDFRNYYSRKYSRQSWENSYLDTIHDVFFDSIYPSDKRYRSSNE